jgi:hypothetical protein
VVVEAGGGAAEPHATAKTDRYPSERIARPYQHRAGHGVRGDQLLGKAPETVNG